MIESDVIGSYVQDVVLPGGIHAVLALFPLTGMAAGEYPEASLHAVLGPRELADAADQYRIPRRQTEHLGGRMAAKSAISHYLRAHGCSIAPRDIVLTKQTLGEEAGRPLALLPPQFPVCDISISHSHDLAVAFVVAGGRAGVDVEKVALRSPGFYEDAFSREERQWLLRYGRLHSRPVAQSLTLGWSVKEAMVKCLGHGLRANLQTVTCRGWAEHGAPAFTLPSLGGAGACLARYIHASTTGMGQGDTVGLIAVGDGYALTALCQCSDSVVSARVAVEGT